MTKEEILKKVRTIEFHSDILANQLFVGSYHSCFKGNGMEFADIRRYAPGDDVKKIDWKVTARQRKAYIKEFVEERELPIFIIVDISASNRFSKKLEKVAEIVATLAFTANKNNDKVGAIFFSDRIEKFIPLKKGKKHSLAILENLIEIQPQGKGTDINGALNFFNKINKRRGIIFLVSDFLTGSFDRAMKITSLHHDLIPVRIHDSSFDSLPKGIFQITDSETGEEMVIESFGDARSDYPAGDFSFKGIDIDVRGDYIKEFLKFFKGRSGK